LLACLRREHELLAQLAEAADAAAAAEEEEEEERLRSGGDLLRSVDLAAGELFGPPLRAAGGLFSEGSITEGTQVKMAYILYNIYEF